MSEYLNFPSAVVRIDSIKALGVMVERVQTPTGVAGPGGRPGVKVHEIPLLIAYTEHGSINLGQVRDHETAIEVKDLFFQFCEGEIDADDFHKALQELAEKIEQEVKAVQPVVKGDPAKN